jgi:hypothetical protein
MPRMLYHQGKRPWYLVDRRPSGLQSQSGCNGEVKNSPPLPGLEPLIIQFIAQCYTTGLSQFLIILLIILNIYNSVFSNKII